MQMTSFARGFLFGFSSCIFAFYTQPYYEHYKEKIQDANISTACSSHQGKVAPYTPLNSLFMMLWQGPRRKFRRRDIQPHRRRTLASQTTSTNAASTPPTIAGYLSGVRIASLPWWWLHAFEILHGTVYPFLTMFIFGIFGYIYIPATVQIWPCNLEVKAHILDNLQPFLEYCMLYCRKFFEVIRTRPENLWLSSFCSPLCTWIWHQVFRHQANLLSA